MARDEQPGGAPLDASIRGRVVIVGAVTRDVFDDREATGGAVTYAARVASAFGIRACVLTTGSRADAARLTSDLSVRPEPVEGRSDSPVRPEPVEGRLPEGRGSTGSPRTETEGSPRTETEDSPRTEVGGSGRAAERERALTVEGRAGSTFGGHEVRWIGSTATLTYRHRFASGARELTLLDRPDRALTAGDLPPEWVDAEVLVLAPLLPDDVDLPSFRMLSGTRERALIAQGLLREATLDEPVRMAEGYPYALFGATSPETSVFLSDEDIAGWPRAAMEAVWSSSRRVVVTRGARGAEVRSGLQRYHVQATPTARPVVDTTGAGDVFATALILALAGGSSEEEAARLASIYAAANIELPGASPLPPLEEARHRLAMSEAAQPGRVQ